MFVILETSTVRIVQAISLNEEDRVKLESYSRGRSESWSPQGLFCWQRRASAISKSPLRSTHAADRGSMESAFHPVGCRRFEKDAPRAGRTAIIDAEAIIRKTTQEKPSNATHWYAKHGSRGGRQPRHKDI